MLRLFFNSKIALFLIITLLWKPQAHLQNKPVVTIITGLWDVKRGEMESQIYNQQRSFKYYLEFFAQMLQTDANLIVFGDNQMDIFVHKYRNRSNTIFINKEIGWFKSQWYTPKMKEVIDHHLAFPEKQFYKNYVQYGLEMYNPILFSKLFLMTEALQHDTFQSDYFVWMDAGLIHVEDKSLFVPTNVLQKFPIYFQGPWVHHSLPGVRGEMRHGFRDAGRQYVKNLTISDFVWGGYYGGRVQAVSTVRNIFQNIVRITLQEKEMWTEENVYSIMVQRYPYMISYVHNLVLTNLGSITFNNIHTPPAIDTVRQFILDIYSLQKSIIVMQSTAFPQKILEANKEMKIEISWYRGLLETTSQKQLIEIVIESILLGVFVVIYLKIRRGMAHLKQYIKAKQQEKPSP